MQSRILKSLRSLPLADRDYAPQTVLCSLHRLEHCSIPPWHWLDPEQIGRPHTFLK